MSDMHDLSQWDSDADYLIYDDIRFDPKFLKGLWGGQRQITMTDKYRKKFTVKLGKPFIFICNEEDDPFEIKDQCGNWVLGGTRADWFRDNCIKVVINERLW